MRFVPVMFLSLISVGWGSYAKAPYLDIRHIATFLASDGEVVASSGGIVVFNNIDYLAQAAKDPNYIGEATASDAKEYQKEHPTWRGESWQIKRYSWDDKRRGFVYSGESFGAGPTTDPIRDMETIEKAKPQIEQFSWSRLIPKNERVQAYVTADLNGDGVKEVVVFVRDTPLKTDEDAVPALIRVFEPVRGSYKEIALIRVTSNSSEDWTKYDRLASLEVKDINGDGIPELLVRSISAGGSGYSVVLDVYARYAGQSFSRY